MLLLKNFYDIKLERLDLVKIGKQTENDFMALTLVSWTNSLLVWELIKCAIYLDTNTLKYDLVPLDLKDNVVVIMNTNKTS